MPRCGNGIVDSGEDCDPGFSAHCCEADCTFSPPGTSCTLDQDRCTIEQCDAEGICRVLESVNGCDDCGTGSFDPCECSVKKGSAAPTLYTDLQQAVNAAPKGAVITVRGRCTGPISISQKADLTIQGIAPANTSDGCPADGLQPGDLTSTVTSTVDEVIKITKVSNIKIKFLNLVDGPSAGLEVKDAAKTYAFCNCIARNAEGLELHGSDSASVVQNLIRRNTGPGIRFNRGKKSSTKNSVLRNSVHENDDGMTLIEKATKNTVRENRIENNVADGILIDDADKNTIADNVISGNGGMSVRCMKGKKNSGNDVPPPCN